MEVKSNDGKEKTTQEPEGIGKRVAEVSSVVKEPVTKDGIGRQPDGEQTLAEMRARLTPEEAVSVREKLQQRSDEAFQAADFKTAAALRQEAQALDAKGLKLTPAEADGAKALLQKRAEDTEKAGDPDTAKALRGEADAVGETSGDVGSGTVLLLLGAAALGLYVMSERQKQAQQAAAAQAAAAAMAAARRQSQSNNSA